MTQPPPPRKTIRKNPLDALGSGPVDQPVQTGRSAGTPTIEAAAEHATSVSNTSPPETDIHREQDPSPADQGPLSNAKPSSSKKSVEALFDEVLAPSAKTSRPFSLKPKLVQRLQHQDGSVDPQALAIVKSWSQWAALGGTVPAPVVDVALISGAQIKMLQLLCKHYGIPFEKKLTFSLVSSLLGGSSSTWLAQTVARTGLKSVPLVGSVISLTVQPALAYATTYAIGRTFMEHFESKGTLLNFSADKMSGAFSRFVQAGRALFTRA